MGLLKLRIKYSINTGQIIEYFQAPMRNVVENVLKTLKHWHRVPSVLKYAGAVGLPYLKMTSASE